MEEYTPFHHQDYQTIIGKLKKFSAGGNACVMSTINGDSNVPFYKEFANQGLTATDCPINVAPPETIAVFPSSPRMRSPSREMPSRPADIALIAARLPRIARGGRCNRTRNLSNELLRAKR